MYILHIQCQYFGSEYYCCNDACIDRGDQYSSCAKILWISYLVIVVDRDQVAQLFNCGIMHLLRNGKSHCKEYQAPLNGIYFHVQPDKNGNDRQRIMNADVPLSEWNDDTVYCETQMFYELLIFIFTLFWNDNSSYWFIWSIHISIEVMELLSPWLQSISSQRYAYHDWLVWHIICQMSRLGQEFRTLHMNIKNDRPTRWLFLSRSLFHCISIQVFCWSTA